MRSPSYEAQKARHVAVETPATLVTSSSVMVGINCKRPVMAPGDPGGRSLQGGVLQDPDPSPVIRIRRLAAEQQNLHLNSLRCVVFFM